MTLARAVTVGETLADARRRLRGAAFAPPTREASLLLSRVLGLDEAALFAHPDTSVAAEDAARFEGLLLRRLDGEPTAYLLGEREFYGRAFSVDRRVLIPRPETEHLVEAACSLDLPPTPRVLDVGTGSGVIALTLALELNGARVTGSDRSAGALAVARANRRRLGLDDRVPLVAADLLDGLLPERFDLIVSNPPYIAPAERSTLSLEITRFEPTEALFAPPDGLGIVRRLLAECEALPPGGRLLLEIGAEQAQSVAALANHSQLALEGWIHDYAGVARVASLRRL